MIEPDGVANDGDQELADQHGERTPDEQWTTTELLNGVEGDWGRAHIHESENERDQECIGDGASGGQEGCRVVKDEVDASPLRRCQYAPIRFRAVEVLTCCIICREVPRMVLRTLDLDSLSEPLKQFNHPLNQLPAGMRARSYSSLAMISASSASMYSDSGG